MYKYYHFRPTDEWFKTEIYYNGFDVVFSDKFDFIETFIKLIIESEFNTDTKIYLLQNLTKFESCDYFTIEELELV